MNTNNFSKIKTLHEIKNAIGEIEECVNLKQEKRITERSGVAKLLSWKKNEWNILSSESHPNRIEEAINHANELLKNLEIDLIIRMQVGIKEVGKIEKEHNLEESTNTETYTLIRSMVPKYAVDEIKKKGNPLELYKNLKKHHREIMVVSIQENLKEYPELKRSWTENIDKNHPHLLSIFYGLKREIKKKEETLVAVE